MGNEKTTKALLNIGTLDHSDKTNETKVRLLVTCPRSGGRLFMRIFRELPSCAVTSHLVLQGNYRQNDDRAISALRPDYSIFQPASHPVYQQAKKDGCDVLFSKEELGHEFHKGECQFQVFPDQDAYALTKPAFLFRDPVRVFDSWVRLGWGDLHSFFACYRSLHQMWKAGKPSAKAVIYEGLVSDPEATVASLCDYWDISIGDWKHLGFTRPFGDFYFNGERERWVYQTASLPGMFNNVRSHSSVVDLPSHGLLSSVEIECIENEVGGLYIDACGTSLDLLRSSLSSKTWYGFDLDDTLHEFRKASGYASEAVLKAIDNEHGIGMAVLRASYSAILKSSTSSAFTDGRTSSEYRKERFGSLLGSHNLIVTEETLSTLAEVYKDNLRSTLTLKAGALGLLQKIKSLERKVIVITEGPKDAQEWTIEELGLRPYIDLLVTTNEIGKSKVDGLFGAVLEKHGIQAHELVYIGDNGARDIVPAQNEGILTVLYDEKSSCRFASEKEFRTNSLVKVRDLID